MLKTFLPYLLVALLAGSAGFGLEHLIERGELAAEKVAHSKDNERHANDLSLMSKAAFDAESRAIDAHAQAASDVAAIDAQLTKERLAHEADNAENRAAIADGTRRLRVAVSNFRAAGGDEADSGASAGSVGDGASGTAELSPAWGAALFGIFDDADSDARAKADYLQQYVCALQRRGLIEGECALQLPPK
ncbi:lysis system i-spanin subunit Rz [Paraburkholderia pallida]|uniref:Lysozyme n=1 Tax=Paraburkholderia pallida TaxID=2547399 RepID=A0A4P7CVP4_9BURK|nr:lysis system i-spanin subunit Rz [Paraburkholderia pallida]QBQ98161.1 lysozyme [Paraburkholderia pallida]